MGHSTNYTGKIRITNLDLDKVRQLKTFLGADKRNLLRDGVITEAQMDLLEYSCFFDMELDQDLTALQWNGSEKSNGLDLWLNIVGCALDLDYQEGDSLLCQGEDVEDRYVIIIEAGAVIVRNGAAESCGTEVFVCWGYYYDEQEIGGVFAKREDAENYCTKRNDETDQYSLTWEVLTRTLA
tara:strand:+ start:3006 stop:3551 length:546 start_codon:yes stop_codon:yes gene_type:complete